MELFAFQAGKQILGIPPQEVVRVVENVPITPVPLTPDCHMGLIYYRGELFDVIHLGSLLKQEKAHHREGDWTVLLKWSGKKLALMPDKVMGLLWVEDQEGEEPVYSQESENIRFISPEYIWERLLEQGYGYQ